MPRPVIAPNTHMLEDQDDQRVWLWDTGPRKPVMPKKPDVPKRDGMEEPEYDLVMIEFKQTLEDYDLALKTYGRLRKEYQEWQTKYGGPFEFQQFSCDAHDTLEREKDRYYISSRTRGHENVPNMGLPPGIRPGHGQAEIERRRREGDELLDTLRRQDPIFGDPSLRAG